jgi:molybdate transport system substrate-binding protein
MRKSLRNFTLVALSLLLFALTGTYSRAQRKEISVAAAADLKFAMTDLAAAYEKQSGVKLTLTFGSSGNFFAQIQNGAPFELFFSADSDYPRKLEQAGLTVPGSIFQYAVGRIVLWAPADAKADPQRLGWRSLLDPAVQKIAVANPDHAPYGRAAIEALKKSGYYDQVKTKLVFGENISQAAQFVQSGNAQIGIIAKSLAVSSAFAAGRSWTIPQQQYTPLAQSAVALKNFANKDAALAFLAYLKTPPAQSILEKYGFTQSTLAADPVPY